MVWSRVLKTTEKVSKNKACVKGPRGGSLPARTSPSSVGGAAVPNPRAASLGSSTAAAAVLAAMGRDLKPVDGNMGPLGVAVIPPTPPTSPPTGGGEDQARLSHQGLHQPAASSVREQPLRAKVG